MSQFSQPKFSFATLSPMLVPLTMPGSQEQERGNNNEAYCDPELYEVPSSDVEYYAQPQPAPLDHTQSSPHLTAPHSDTNQVTGVPHLQNLPLDAVGATIQEERDVQWIHQWIKGRHWLKVNTHEPLVGSQDSSPLVDEYGIRGFSCYSSLVERKDDGTFGCRRERCVHFSARSMEGAITHQRTHHYNHKPYKCSDVTGVRCNGRFFSAAGTKAHIRNCHTT